MPWCPECRTEYVEGVARCYDCGAALVEELDRHGPEPSGPERFPDLDALRLAVSAADDLEAGMLESLLEAGGIPVLRKYGGAGSAVKAYMGETRFGVDLYVPESCAARALELLRVRREECADAPEAPEAADGQEDGRATDMLLRVRRASVLILRVAAVAGAALLAVYVLGLLYTWLRYML